MADKLVVTAAVVQEFLGGIKVRVGTEIAERTQRSGVAVGLAWTPAGEEILFIEANRAGLQRGGQKLLRAYVGS